MLLKSKLLFNFIFLTFASAPILAQQASADLLRAAEIRTSAIKLFCVNKPKVDISIIEKIASLLKVNPRSISFERAEYFFEEDSILKVNLSNCLGVFYTEKGPLKCNLEFSKEGAVQKACDASVVISPFTEQLTANINSVMLRPLKNQEAYGPGGKPLDGWAPSNPLMGNSGGTAPPLERRVVR